VLQYKLNELDKAVDLILSQGKKCIAFYAPMGAGKTTLINAICKKLEVVDVTSSPTFSIINEYALAQNGKIVHMDWYRLKGEEDAINAGVEDYLVGDNYTFVEWPEIAEGLLPEDCCRCTIEIIDEDTREVIFI
jgi:tRNA threonylcarbamoyladenosine biosynthesis protein TsaE